jgi:hypothetical protein
MMPESTFRARQESTLRHCITARWLMLGTSGGRLVVICGSPSGPFQQKEKVYGSRGEQSEQVNAYGFR